MKAHIKNIFLGLILSGVTTTSFAVEKTYQQYQALLTNLEKTEAVSVFIEENNYLSDRLRKKWLSYLADKEQWKTYLDYYQPTSNLDRQCFYVTALYATQQSEKAASSMKNIWESAAALSPPCYRLLFVWQHTEGYTSEPLWQRISVAMEHKRYKEVNQLKTYLSLDDQAFIKQWLHISRYPTALRNTDNMSHPQTPRLFTHGLRELIKKDLQMASKLWRNVKEKYAFTLIQQQSVYQQFALYAALRNRHDAESYFKKLIPELTPLAHHEWRLRAALKQQRWSDVVKLIPTLPEELRTKPCWQYWYARALAKRGEVEKAQALYASLSEQRTYYGFLASYRAGLPLTMNHTSYDVSDSILEKHQQKIDHINVLYANKDLAKASLMSYELANELSPQAQYKLAQMYAQWQWHDKALNLANSSGYFDDVALRFPLGHDKYIEDYSEKYNVEEAFIYAIIRQESTFRDQVMSHAGAIGLMQLVPSTAKKIAKTYNIAYKGSKDLYQVAKNLELGTAYLSHLGDRLKGHPVLIAAAYNAGPQQVKRWLKKSPLPEMDIWIETLPWKETRNYLKNVTAFYAVYQYRLNQPLSIERFMRAPSPSL